MQRIENLFIVFNQASKSVGFLTAIIDKRVVHRTLQILLHKENNQKRQMKKKRQFSAYRVSLDCTQTATRKYELLRLFILDLQRKYFYSFNPQLRQTYIHRLDRCCIVSWVQGIHIYKEHIVGLILEITSLTFYALKCTWFELLLTD